MNVIVREYAGMDGAGKLSFKRYALLTERKRASPVLKGKSPRFSGFPGKTAAKPTSNAPADFAAPA
jgi:hypothetical protein